MSEQNPGNVFPQNSLREDPNLRNDFPLIKYAIDIPATDLVAGTFEIADQECPIALADVVGVEFANNMNAAGEILGAFVEAPTTTGAGLDVNIVSSKVDSTTADVTGTVYVLGRLSGTEFATPILP